MTTLATHDPAAICAGWTEEALRALWYRVLEQAIHDATARRLSRYPHSGTTLAEQVDAREFLTDPERLGDVCDALEIDTAWFQTMLRRQYPQIWEAQ